MASKRFTPEQIISKLRATEVLLFQLTVQSPMLACCHTGNLAFVPLVLKFLERHLNRLFHDQGFGNTGAPCSSSQSPQLHPSFINRVDSSGRKIVRSLDWL